VLEHPKTYDVIVIGAGHAGCEAALATARIGLTTLLLTANLDTVAQMSCNPAIGGLAKGQLVREIDALGGEMARCIDQTGIQFRLLNRRKGPAVRSSRAQADRCQYRRYMKRVLEEQDDLDLKQAIAERILAESPFTQTSPARPPSCCRNPTCIKPRRKLPGLAMTAGKG